ncbi:MAG TPA: DNA polymerase IV [Candidatus Competibacteraceae bacterium]|nr:DNA polymerase IV [Candidatus Competibacteraceae bacterium]
MAQQRKIIHIDMDAFYAAVEQRDFPKYRGKPVVVGGDPHGRGVVATASYEARRYGIHSAMPAAHAYRLCPQAVFLRPRFEVYRQVSREIQAILRQFSERIEPLSLDEAYLGVTDCDLCHGSATLMARQIKRLIREKTQLSASAGVSYNKFLAKLASDQNKPDGLCVITPEEGPAFIQRLPIGKFHGVGKATEARMKALGIHTGADLLVWPLERLVQHFGKVGAFYYQLARGIDERPVESARVRKSLGAETTFAEDLSDSAEMLEQLRALTAEVAADLAKRCLAGRTLTIKVKYDNFEQVTRSHTFPRPLSRVEDMVPHLPDLLARTEAGRRRVRLLGVTVSGFDEEEERGWRQLALF